MKDAKRSAAHGLRNRLDNQRSEKALGHAHVQAPQRDTQHDHPDVRRHGENNVRDDEDSEARRKHRTPVGPIGECPHRIGRSGKDDVHDHEDERD